jgi:inosine/xanthosine triphosphatase
VNVIIASTRTPKVEGTKRGIVRAASALALDASSLTFTSVEAPSGVSDTPKSINELLEGARNRSVSVFRADGISVGVEGGLFRADGATFLQSWACIHDGSRFVFGASGAIAIPAALASEVMDAGTDLGKAIDVFAGSHDVRSKQGTWGILTNDHVSREDSFDQAVFHAAMAFFKKY